MEKERDPEKFHVLDNKKKNLLFIISAVLVFIFVPLLSFYYIKFAINRPAQTVDEHTIEIEPGWSVARISQELYANDSINSRALFTFYVLFNNLEKNIQAGIYTIPAGTSIKELANLLQHGTNDLSVTFLEGWRVEQFALKASENFKDVDYEDFVLLASDDEGYLFSDTYVFPSDITPTEMIEHLKETFNKKTEDVLAKEALDEVGLDKEEVVILASIVEREVADPVDRSLVAGVLVKRYQEGKPLGADATVQYYAPFLRIGCDLESSSSSICPKEEVAREIDWWPYSLTQSELDYDSEYNTRKNTGLPPTPISSISISALEAVLNNKQTVYNYYLTDAEGTTHFSETLQGHENNIDLYLR